MKINKKYLIRVRDYMLPYPRLRRRILTTPDEWLPIITINTGEGEIE